MCVRSQVGMCVLKFMLFLKTHDSEQNWYRASFVKIKNLGSLLKIEQNSESVLRSE